ncbi:MAG TPA: type II secretion system F family protein [bacterium]|nr:type II secretion system F family protein [bacterium]
MPKFQYEGVNAQGQKTKGEFEAANLQAAQSKLKAQQIKPTVVKEKSGGIGNMELKIPWFKPKVKERDLVLFTRQFATMIDAGLPLVQCLDIQSQQAENPSFREQLKEIKATVEAGSTFADALRKYPKTFDELFVNLIAAGEVGGILDTILSRLAAYIEKASKLKKQVRGAMVYPSAVVGVATIVVTVILWKVIPVFAAMFHDFGAALPAPTVFVMNLSAFVQKYILLMIVGTIGAIIGIRRLYAWKPGRREMDDLFLKAPIFGPLIRKVAVARFTRTLGTMITSGVPILDALEICAKTAGNMTIEAAIQKVRQSISEGRTIAEPLAETKVFPPMVVQMISVGEATGALDTMLGKIADFYDEEVDQAVGALTSLIEPLLMVVLGGAVGGLVVAMYLPIFTIANTLQ